MTTSAETEFGPQNAQSRIEMFEVLACDGEYAGLAENATFDLAHLTFQMMAAELVSLREKVETQADAVVFMGSLVNGLMGLSTLVHLDDEDPEIRKLRDIAQKTGAIIRKSAGLKPLGEVGPGEP